MNQISPKHYWPKTCSRTDCQTTNLSWRIENK